MTEEKINIVKAYLLKSSDKLKAAVELFSSGFYDDSSSRTYYSIFHILSAMLFSRGLVYNSHKEIIGNFNKEFIKTGIMPDDLYKKIRFTYENRESGDYEIKKRIDEKTASICLTYAGEIYKSGVKYLSEFFQVDEEYWNKSD